MKHQNEKCIVLVLSWTKSMRRNDSDDNVSRDSDGWLAVAEFRIMTPKTVDETINSN